MANVKLSAKTELDATPASGDLLHIVDVSDTTDASTGTSKKITRTNLIGGLAASGANSDITSLTGLTTALTVAQGGSGAATLTGILKGNGTSAFTAVTAPSGALVGDTDTQTLSAKTLTAPKFADLGFIADANGNELIILDTVASAVNEITLSNNSTGLNPVLTMSGETNVGLDVKMKAAGYFRRPTIVEIPVGDSATSLATGDGKAFFRVPDELNGMNLTGVAAAVYTAGTTGTLDVQIRNKTQTADMLTTKLTIDSTETDTSTAATAAVIDTANDDVATADVIAIDIDAVHTTPAKGLVVQMRFELPA